MSTESCASPTGAVQATAAGEGKMPSLPPGYHFIISFCEVLCSREQIDAIHGELVDIARGLIREYALRTETGRFANTRVHIQRTAPLIEPDLSFDEHEHKVGDLRDLVEAADGDGQKPTTESAVGVAAEAAQAAEKV